MSVVTGLVSSSSFSLAGAGPSHPLHLPGVKCVPPQRRRGPQPIVMGLPMLHPPSAPVERLEPIPKQTRRVQRTVLPRRPASAPQIDPMRVPTRHQTLAPPLRQGAQTTRRQAVLHSLLLGAAAAGLDFKTNHPVIEAWGACELEPHAEGGLVAAVVSRALYPHGSPKVEDVVQGRYGDCFFLAALIAVLHRCPQVIHRRIRVTGLRADGTPAVQVAFSDPRRPGASTWMCVSEKFPAGSAQGALWVQAFEKAFVKYNDAFKVMIDPALPGYDTYDTGGLGQGFEALTGKPAMLALWPNQSNPDAEHTCSVDALLELFRDRHTVGDISFRYCGPQVPGRMTDVRFEDGSHMLVSPTGIMKLHTCEGDTIIVVPGHAYAVMDVNAAGDLLVRNPWGTNIHTADAEFWIPQRYLDHIAFRSIFVRV